MTITVAKAKKELAQLIERALQGEEVIITRANQPLVRLKAISAPRKKPSRIYGSMKGLVTYMAPDFTDPLELRPSEK
jgi:prevent-host-death family protein